MTDSVIVRYPATIDGVRGAYGIVIVDMPGACCAMGATVDEALAAAEVALADFARLMEENGETIPTPSAIDEVNLESGEMVSYVPLSLPIVTR